MRATLVWPPCDPNYPGSVGRAHISTDPSSRAGKETTYCGRLCIVFFFFFQAEDGIRDPLVTGVQTCALPIYSGDTRRDHRQLHGHGFQQYVGYSITIPVTRDLAGQREHGRATIQINQFILGHFANQLDDVVQPMATDKTREPVVLLAITHNLAAHELPRIAQESARFDQSGESLLLPQASDTQ